jgi:hypothetical protein
MHLTQTIKVHVSSECLDIDLFWSRYSGCLPNPFYEQEFIKFD